MHTATPTPHTHIPVNAGKNWNDTEINGFLFVSWGCGELYVVSEYVGARSMVRLGTP